MNSIVKRLLIILGCFFVLFSIAQLIARNIFVAESVQLASATSKSDSLIRRKQGLISRIAELESPVRLSEIGLNMGLEPLPLENFILLEVE